MIQQFLSTKSNQVNVLEDGSIEVLVEGRGKRVFSPEFTVLYRTDDPQMKFKKVEGIHYNMPSWKLPDNENGENGEFLPHEFEAEEKKEEHVTMNVYKSGYAVTVKAEAVHCLKNRIFYSFPVTEGFMLEAELHTEQEFGYPSITFTLVPRKEGWYSVGYTGAPCVSPDEMEAMWQPLVWQEKRFPDQPYLTTEFNCPVPSALVTVEGMSTGVVSHPKEMPFRLSTAKNSRFGIAVRNDHGLAQPVVFAPVMGGPESFMASGQPYRFSLILYADQGDWVDNFERITREIFEFHDHRRNSTCSLNRTFENMIEYGMNDEYSAWNSELKGCSYQTDVPGSVKIVSSLHPMGVALVTDREDIFEHRALPMMEYLMSREKFLFAMREEVKGQGASHYLAGPCAPASELAALYNLSKGVTRVFEHYAREIYSKPAGRTKNDVKTGATWQNALAVYKITKDPSYLQETMEKADEYIRERIEKPQVTFEEESFFWTHYAPKWADLLELYEVTKEEKYLEAAVDGAREFCTFIWMCPSIPQEDILVNEGGKTSRYWYARGPEPMRVPEERVPAWRVSEIGLTCEASGTGHGHRGIFIAYHAPAFLKLAHYAKDAFLQEVARSAIVGRYSNFPGYHMNTERSTVYEKPDYPYHEFKELTYNTFHFNHIWPHISLILEYLVSDVFHKSEGRIHFPSQYSECYAYMQSSIYGGEPGEFYEEKDVWLWMPKGLVTTDNIQINYITARGNGKLCIALANQCEEDLQTVISLSDQLIPGIKEKEYTAKVWIQNRLEQPVAVKNGQVKVQVKGKGITAMAIEGVEAKTEFQHRFMNVLDKLSKESYFESSADFGKIKGMILSMGREFTRAYIYLEATEKNLDKAVLHYRAGKEDWNTVFDSTYPFEFTIPLQEDAEQIELKIEGILPNGTRSYSEIMVLKK